MSVSILEVIEAGGYDLNTVEDANWLLAQQNQFEELVESAQAIVDKAEELEMEESEKEYKESFPDEELLSNCCSATMHGEPVNRTMHDDDIIEGRCADCKEMATFEKGES